MCDITMCLGKECPLRDKCFRYRAFPDGLQSYFITSPYENGECDRFVPFDWRCKVRSIDEVINSNEDQELS